MIVSHGKRWVRQALLVFLSAYKVMVNMFLNYIWAMRPNFIAVDAMASDEPAETPVKEEPIAEPAEQPKKAEKPKEH